jgi:hypothetical protein
MESPWLNTLNAMLPDFTFPPVPQPSGPRDMHRWEAAVRVNLDYWGVSDVLEGDPHAAQVASVWFRGLERIDRAFNTVADGLVGWVPRWAARVSGVDEVVEDQERKLTNKCFDSQFSPHRPCLPPFMPRPVCCCSLRQLVNIT